MCEITVVGTPSGGQRIDVHGSGVLVSKNADSAVVLTAMHNLREASGKIIQVRFPVSRENFIGTLLSGDDSADAASLTLSGSPSVPPAVMADDAVQVGERITLAGMGGSPRAGFAATAARSVRPADGGLMYCSAPSSQGDSGGPVFDNAGRVCGLIVMSSDSETVMVCGRRGERLRPLRCLLGDLVTLPARIIAPRPRVQVNINPAQRFAPATTAPVTPDIPIPTTPDIPPATETPTVDTEAIIAAVIERIKEDPTLRGPAGPTGPPGDPGPAGPVGPRGEPGIAAAIDTLALAEAIRSALPGITVRTIDGAGNVIDSEKIPLGGTLNLIHKPLSTK